jgi:glycosyltransferase involved in cell wall biosynthesis/SAM-dependent methyltransferase
MKIAYLVASSDVSGGQRVIFQQAEALAKASHTVTLICPENKPTWFPLPNVKWEKIPFSKSKALREAHVCVATYWTTVSHAVKAFAGPVFHLCQGYEADFSFNHPFKEEIEAVYALPTHKMAVSPHVVERLKSLGYAPVSHVGQTFDSHEFPPPPETRTFKNTFPVILLPGIFESDVKGISEALEALAKLRERGTPFYLWRVSTWPLSEAEKKICLSQEYSLRLTPPQMVDTYWKSDLLIAPSHPEEGFGLHVLEALSTGLPVLISDTPGHRYIAQNAAEYFKWGDSSSILQKIKTLREHPDRLRELSKMGPPKARRFSTEAVAQKLIDLFEKSLESKNEGLIRPIKTRKRTHPMHHPLTIFWPAKPPPDIEEIRFSFDFCRKMSRRFCKMAYPDALWYDYKTLESIETLFSKAAGHVLILITEPELVLSPQAIRILHDLGQAGHDICGPVYNQSAFTHQIASLPAVYVDMDSFLEVSDMLAEQKPAEHPLVSSGLDPACISFRLDFLKELEGNKNFLSTLKAPFENPFGSLTVARDALVHSGFLKAFTSQRNDLVRLVPERGIHDVLDVGCAMGGYGKTLKELYPQIRLTGVELNSMMADKAAPYYDEMFNVPLEQARFRGRFDLINCGDILEHLTNPWGILKRLRELLRVNGRLVLSIPNAGHWSVVRALLKGRFQYIPLGLLCIGHLRWFTEISIQEGLEEAGFSIELLERQQIPPTPQGNAFIRDMCKRKYGDEASLKTNEFVIRAANNPP